MCILCAMKKGEGKADLVRYRKRRANMFRLLGEGRSLTEVASRFRISKQRLHQIVRKYASRG